MRAMSLSSTEYPAVRRVMSEHHLRLDDEDVESMLGELFPDSAPRDVESFMGTLQRFGNDVVPIAQRALPGAVQGAVTGASIGGPYGALAGAALGAVGSLTGSPGPTQRTAPVTAPAPVQTPSAPALQSPTPAPPSSTVTMTSNVAVSPDAAAKALLEILSNRATLEALQAMLMQTAGRPTVKVGDKQVPPAAFANAIAEFAAIAAEHDTATEARADYLYGESGWPRGDLASPAERATILLSDLREAARDNESPISAYERVAHGWQPDG